MSPLPTPKAKPSLLRLSSDADVIRNIIFLIYGQFKVGKSTMALTASAKFPKTGLPTQKHRGPPKYILDDMLWISYDRGATLGFKERGVAVPELDVRQLMGDKKMWKEAGFSTAPNVTAATEYVVREAEKITSLGNTKWIVVDTVSTYDKMLENTFRKQHPEDGRAVFGKVLLWHGNLHNNLVLLNCGIIYLCHLHAIVDMDKDTAEKNAKIRKTLTSPGTPTIVPAITGKGAGLYKADNRCQLLLKGVRPPGGQKGLLRTVSTVQTPDGEECGNAFQLSLSETEEPDLSKILAKIAG